MKRISVLLGFIFFLSFIAYSNSGNNPIESGGTTPTARTKMMQLPPIRVVCIGSSIIEGYGNTSQEKAWSTQVNKLQGNRYTVINCGVSGTTMFKNSEASYWATSIFVNPQNEVDVRILKNIVETN